MRIIVNTRASCMVDETWTLDVPDVITVDDDNVLDIIESTYCAHCGNELQPGLSGEWIERHREYRGVAAYAAADMARQCGLSPDGRHHEAIVTVVSVENEVDNEENRTLESWHVTGTPDPERPRTSCGCGYELVWVDGQWQHDAAPGLWGDDHGPDAADEDPAGEIREHWDREDGVIE